MSVLLALLTAAASPLDPGAFALLDGGAGLTAATPSTLDPSTGVWTVDATPYQGVLSDEGAWVFAFQSLDIAADLTVEPNTLDPRPIVFLSRSSLTVGATLDAAGAGHGTNTGPAPGLGVSGAGHGGPGAQGASGTPGLPYGDPVLRPDLGSGARSNARGGGAIQLIAVGALTLTGTIDASGLATPAGAGGSGGGVLLDGGAGSACTGSIDVSGGADPGGAEGGGGRVVLIDVDASTCAITGADAAGPTSAVGVRVDTTDADGDGWPASHDPDDTDPNVVPRGIDGCDGRDDDLDGLDGELHVFHHTGWTLLDAAPAELSFPVRTPSRSGGRLTFPAGVAADVLVRAPLPTTPGARTVGLNVDKPVGEPVRVGLSDGSTWIGVVLQGGSAVAVTGADTGAGAASTTSSTLGALADDGAFDVRFTLADDAVAITVTNRAGASVTGSLTATLDPTALDALLVASAAGAARVDVFGAQSLADADGDGVGDLCDVCPDDAPDDTDGDGVCDSDDLCAAGPDQADLDGDGTPDACDPCPLDPLDDVDGDGVCDGDDLCPGDDLEDADLDGVCDGLDVCPGGDDTDDADLDAVPDACDICPGFSDHLDADGDGTPDGCEAACAGPDTDGDGTPDACDVCPADPGNDPDGDGVCAADDLCPGFDDALDADGDGVPDGCDPCPADAPDDPDGDGVCTSDDLCPAGDDDADADADGVPDACDPCPLEDDTDGDGVCDSFDVCPDADDALDADGDGAPDACDLCPTTASEFQGDFDGDGVGDACDPCPLDNPDDADGDGECDTCVDADGDGECDTDDLCEGDDGTGDADGDGFCADIDCDDGDDTVFPGAPELCDGLDNACTGVAPDEDGDLDGDGVSICAGDCADQDPERHPGAEELCNGIDDDCDGSLGAEEADDDGDGSLACDDCDDDDPLASPRFPEVCGDGIDNDCDGGADPVCEGGVPDGAVVDDQGGCSSAPAPHSRRSAGAGPLGFALLGGPLLVFGRRRRGGAR